MICDHLQIDSATGKYTLFGCFENIQAPAFPTGVRSLVLFAELTDGRGQIPMTLKFVRTTPDAVDGEVLYTQQLGTLDFTDPRMILRLNMTIELVPFPEPGEYRFILETQGSFVAERRLVAVQAG